MKKRAMLFAAASMAVIALVGYGLSGQMKQRSAEYAWLVFGPTETVRALVSFSGDTITIQCFSSEEPTGRKEQFKDRGQPLEIALADPDGVTSYVIRKCATPPPKTAKGRPTELFVNVDVNGPVTFRQYCDITAMARDIKTAPISHFHGALAIRPVTVDGEWELPSKLTLPRGGTGIDLRAMIGTMDAERGCWVVVKTHADADTCLFPDAFRPVADIEFPPKKPGDPPIKRRYTLDDFCCGSIFHGPVRVPDEAGDGKAKVTLSFETWTEGKVVPLTIYVPIIEPQRNENGGK